MTTEHDRETVSDAPCADDVTDADLRLHAGEMTASEVRACRAGYRLAMSRIERARGSAQSDAPASPQAAQGDLAALNPADVAFECYPATPDGGMTVGVPRGVKATHRPTGCVSIVTHHRSQHLNRDAAIAALAMAADSAQPATAKPAAENGPYKLLRDIHGHAEAVADADDHPAYWGGMASGVEGACARITDALDGKDNGDERLGNAALEALRRRILALGRPAEAQGATQTDPQGATMHLDLAHIIQRFKARGGVSAQCAAELEAEMRNAEPDGWLVKYTREDGEQVRYISGHNPVGDFRDIDPSATSEPFAAVAISKFGGDEA